jgi:hypothetical protein
MSKQESPELRRALEPCSTAGRSGAGDEGLRLRDRRLLTGYSTLVSLPPPAPRGVSLVPLIVLASAFPL